jgi:hypothetical protein
VVNQEARLEALRVQQEQLDRKITHEQNRLERVIKDTAQADAGIMACKQDRCKFGGAFAGQESNKRAARQEFFLEGRLGRTKEAHDRIVSASGTLKRQIDDLRLTRIAQERAYKQLSAAIEKTKLGLAAALEKSEQVYEDRDKILAEVRALRKGAKAREAAMAEQEEVLQRQIIELKTQEVLKKREPEVVEEVTVGNLTDEEEDAIRDRIVLLEENSSKMRKELAEADDMIDQYGEVFKQMMKQCGLETLNDLVKMFVDAEDTKYKTYTYIQGIQQDINGYSAQLQEVRDSIQTYMDTEGNLAQERKSKQRGLLNELHGLRQSVSDFQRRTITNRKRVEEIVEALRRVYVSSGGSRRQQSSSTAVGDGESEAIQWETLGESLNEDIAADVMGTIEERTAESVTAFRTFLQTPVGRSIVNREAQMLPSAAGSRVGTPMGSVELGSPVGFRPGTFGRSAAGPVGDAGGSMTPSRMDAGVGSATWSAGDIRTLLAGAMTGASSPLRKTPVRLSKLPVFEEFDVEAAAIQPPGTHSGGGLDETGRGYAAATGTGAGQSGVRPLSRGELLMHVSGTTPKVGLPAISSAWGSDAKRASGDHRRALKPPTVDLGSPKRMRPASGGRATHGRGKGDTARDRISSAGAARR